MNPNTRKLHDLGQSLWLDNITREILTSGTLARYISDLSITGLTSNPTIFEHAIDEGGGNNINHETALSETGQYINGRLDGPPLKHDILTGSKHDGTAFPPGEDRTCGNWTKSGTGTAMLGHHDRMGLSDDEGTRSWNASHPSAGCDDASLAKTGSGGLLYCFAAN